MFGCISAPVTTVQYRAERRCRKRASNLHRPRVFVQDRMAGVGDRQAPVPPASPSVVAVPTPCARDTVAGSGVDGCEDHVSCSGCLSMNARHTSTTGPCLETWESDSIVGARSVGEGIHTEVEPVSRFIIAWKTNVLTAECGITAQHSIFSTLPPHARRSVTMDNGTQDVSPLRAESPVGMDTYFTDPCTGWRHRN